MIDGSNKAVIDTDFLLHILEIRNIDPYCLFCKVFQAVGQVPIMHTLVYRHEVPQQDAIVKKLIEEPVIDVIEFDNFLETPDQKLYYEIVLDQLYANYTGQSIKKLITDVFSDWPRQNSLGEMHSLTMCLIIGCAMFCSDDNDSKRIIQCAGNSITDISKVLVFNRKDLGEKLRIEHGDKFNREEIRLLTRKRTG